MSELRVNFVESPEGDDDVYRTCQISAPLQRKLHGAVMATVEWKESGKKTSIPLIPCSDIDDDVIRVPPLVALRLGLPHLDALREPLWVALDEVSSTLKFDVAEKLVLLPALPDIHPSTDISVNHSLRGSADAAADAALRNYFSEITRYVAVGDAIFTDSKRWYIVGEVYTQGSESCSSNAVVRAGPQTVLAVGTPMRGSVLPDRRRTARLAAMAKLRTIPSSMAELKGADKTYHAHILRALQSAQQMASCRPAFLLTIKKGAHAQPRSLLARAGAALGVPLYVMDARLLWDIDSGRMRKIDGLSTACSGSSDDECVYLAPNSEVSSIIALSPCILYIEGLDALIADIQGISSASGTGDADAALQTWCAGVRRFMLEVQEACDNRTLSYRSTALTAGSTRRVVVISSSSEEMLPREVLKTFPATLRLEEASVQSDNIDHIPKSSMADILSSIPVRLKESVRTALNTLGASSSSCNMLISEAQRQAMQRTNMPNWFQIAGIRYDDVNRAAPVECRDEESIDSSQLELLTESDVRAAAQVLQRAYDCVPDDTKVSSNIAAVLWKDIGGLDKVRSEILDMVELPRKKPELFPPGCPVRRAALLFGPPGTGKTLVARAVATECDMHFMSVKGPELLDVYVGESEANVRKTFAQARANQPCVVFFDELDALAPARGRGGDGGGVMDRVVSQLLTEMDSLSHCAATPDAGVFVIGATNRPDLLDAALLRPGRFDRAVYLPPCREVVSKLAVLEAQTRTVQLADDVDLSAVAEALPADVTGADIGAVVSMAVAQAQRRLLKELRQRARKNSVLLSETAHIESGVDSESDSESESESESDTGGGHEEDEETQMWAIAQYINALPASQLQLQVRLSELLQAVRAVRPSVSAAELQHYETLARTYGDS